jgi:hypothetical protein
MRPPSGIRELDWVPELRAPPLIGETATVLKIDLHV